MFSDACVLIDDVRGERKGENRKLLWFWRLSYGFRKVAKVAIKFLSSSLYDTPFKIFTALIILSTHSSHIISYIHSFQMFYIDFFFQMCTVGYITQIVSVFTHFSVFNGLSYMF